MSENAHGTILGWFCDGIVATGAEWQRVGIGELI